MSLGATMSAPARACDTASRASSSSVASLSTSPSRANDAAVPVIGVLAQTDVGDHDELRQLALERAHGLLHRRLVVPCFGPDRRPCDRESRTAARRRPRRRAASAHRAASRRPRSGTTPGIDSTGCRTPAPERTNSGSTSCDAGARSRERVAQRLRATEAARAIGRILGHGPEKLTRPSADGRSAVSRKPLAGC